MVNKITDGKQRKVVQENPDTYICIKASFYHECYIFTSSEADRGFEPQPDQTNDRETLQNDDNFLKYF